MLYRERSFYVDIAYLILKYVMFTILHLNVIILLMSFELNINVMSAAAEIKQVSFSFGDDLLLCVELKVKNNYND